MYNDRTSRLSDAIVGERRQRRMMVKWIIAAAAIVIVLAVALPMCSNYFNEKTVTTTVVSKENVCKSSGSGDDARIKCEYLIFTNAGTFKIEDALFGVTRFNSSDIYGRVREGHVYKIVYYGWRQPMFDMYPNIKSITEVTS